MSITSRLFKGETADNEEEADRWYADKKNNRRTLHLLPRDEVALAINSEVKAFRQPPRRSSSTSTRDGPRTTFASAAVDVPPFQGAGERRHHKEPMEVGPCHYVMGGVRVDADTAQSTVKGLFAAGEVAGGMHGSNRLGGNSLSDLLVFGRRAGLHAALYAKNFGGTLTVDSGQVEQATRQMLAPFERTGGENPYAIQSDLQETMHTLVGSSELASFRSLSVWITEGSRGRSRRRHRIHPAGTRARSRFASHRAACSAVALSSARRAARPYPRRTSDTDDTWAMNVRVRSRGPRAFQPGDRCRRCPPS